MTGASVSVDTFGRLSFRHALGRSQRGSNIVEAEHEQPPVVKPVWSKDDFDVMGWHDCAVHAVALEPAPPSPGRLLVDLDYALEWIQPVPPATAFRFWIAPATLVFEGASDLRADVDLTGWAFDLELDTITRSEPDRFGERTWLLEGYNFRIELRAPGFRQYLRRRPILSSTLRLGVQPRGGIGFEEAGWAES